MNGNRMSQQKKKNDFRCMITLIRECTRFETSQRFFLQEFSTHRDARDRQKRKQKRIYTVYATTK